jgi:hypothetical protein
MERMGKIFAAMIAGVFLLPPAGNADEMVCKEQRVKKVPHICGSVISPLGEPVPNAKVMIFRDGMEVVEVQSGANGKFSFENLKEGNDEIHVQAYGYESFGFPILVVKPAEECKRALQIPLSIRSSSCAGNIRFVKP